MTEHDKPISPLRQRMIEDMTLRKLTSKTQSSYIRAVYNLTCFLRRSPDTATAEELRSYQLHLVSEGISRGALNAALTGLRFFYTVTVKRREVLEHVSSVPEPQRLPRVLSVEEVQALLAAATNLKYKAALSVAYGAGLRAGEVVSLKVSDIDSQRMVIRVEEGKGLKDGYAMLSPKRLELLRQWWREGRRRGKLLNGGWLFPGQNPICPLTTRQLNRACHAAAEAAGLNKPVSMHVLRHNAESLIMPN